jgi:hypothetical protein
MGSGEVGGDGSVKWNLQGNKTISHNSSSTKPGHRQHQGKDETDPGDPYFHVTIKLPQHDAQRTEFLDSLQMGLTNGQRGYDVTFKLRIEDKDNHGPTEDQVRIAWTSLGDSGPGQPPKIPKASAPRRAAPRSASTRTSKRRKRRSGKRR